MSTQLKTSRPIKMLRVVSFDWNRVLLFVAIVVVVFVVVVIVVVVIYDWVALKMDEDICVARIRMIPIEDIGKNRAGLRA